MNDMVNFQNAGLPANPADYATALGQVPVNTGAGKDILKLDRDDGAWIYGIDGNELEEGARIAFNPYSIMHGGVQWSKDFKKVDEKMAPITQPSPMIAMQLDPNLYDMQMSIDGVIVGGVDDGCEVIYPTNSKGGLEAMGLLAQAIGAQMAKDPAKCVPLVRMESTSYEHKALKRIVHKPVFTIVGWTSMDAKPEAAGGDEADPTDTVEEQAEANPRRRRRSRG